MHGWVPRGARRLERRVGRSPITYMRVVVVNRHSQRGVRTIHAQECDGADNGHRMYRFIRLLNARRPIPPPTLPRTDPLDWGTRRKKARKQGPPLPRILKAGFRSRGR